MEGYQKDNYKKNLTQSLLARENNKPLKAHYVDSHALWIVTVENDSTIHGRFESPELLVEGIEVGHLVNREAIEKIVEARKTMKDTIGAKARLFYMDSLYGDKHNLRGQLKESNALPGSEMAHEDIMGMFDNSSLDGATGPGDDLTAPGQGIEGSLPITEMDDTAIHEICTEVYESLMMNSKQIMAESNDMAHKYVAQEMYEQLWDSRKKMIEGVISKIQSEREAAIQPDPQQGM